MAKVLVLYYSSYGHVETLANAVAEGARSVPGTVADVKRVPELVPPDLAEKSHYRMNQAAPVAQVDDLKGYDAIIIGSPTRFGNMASQMKNFLDQAGGLWATDALVGKVGSAFTSTATPHGGQESTLLTIHNVLLHFGLVIVGLPYSYKGQMDPSVVQGGTPYGASTVAGGMGQLQPTPGDLEGARFQGAHVAKIAAKLAA